MTRDEFIAYLAAVKTLNDEERAAALAAYDAAAEDTPETPATPEDVLTGAVVASALLLLFARRLSLRRAQARLQALNATARLRLFEGLYNGPVSARRLPASLRAWHLVMRDRLATGYASAFLLGARRMPTPAEFAALRKRLSRELVRLDRFAAERHARVLLGRPMSPEQIAARSQMYRGGMRGEYFRQFQGRQRPGMVIYFEGPGDDGRTCLPCIDAVDNSPYLPGQAPNPGAVCRGGGFCRHVLRASFEPDTYNELRRAA